MDRQQLYILAKEAGLNVEAGKRDGVMVIEGKSGLCEASLAKLVELVADLCSNIAFEGGYNCLCEDNIRQKMTLQVDADECGAEDITDRLKVRVLAEHGGKGEAFRDHMNLTRGDSMMHAEAAAEIELLRRELMIERQKRATYKPSSDYT